MYRFVFYILYCFVFAHIFMKLYFDCYGTLNVYLKFIFINLCGIFLYLTHLGFYSSGDEKLKYRTEEDYSWLWWTSILSSSATCRSKLPFIPWNLNESTDVFSSGSTLWSLIVPTLPELQIRGLPTPGLDWLTDGKFNYREK